MENIAAAVRELIAKNDLDEALSLISNHSNYNAFSDEIIMLSARKNDIDKSRIKDVISLDEYTRHKNKVVESLLLIVKKIDKPKPSSSIDLKYGEEYKEMNQKRWIEQVSDGELRQLIQELVIKENQNTKIKGKSLKDDFKNQIQSLSSQISNELSRLKHLFPKNELVKGLKDSTFIGIDFGTSNTVISYMCYFADREDFSFSLPQPIELPFYKPKTVNEFIIPSAIYYDEEENLLHFGIDAKRNKRYLHNEGRNYWSSFKTKLGLDYGDIFYESKLNKDETHRKILNADQATKVFFSWLKEQIEHYVSENNLPGDIYFSVSIPASFSSNKRLAYLKVLEETGINTDESILIDEPNAAFINCLISLSIDQVKDFQQSHIIAFDFGAGTCDISILEFWQDGKGAYHSKNFSTSSDNLIGGNDIDYQISKKILFESFLEESGLQDEYMTPEQTEHIISNLKPIAESLKISANKRLLKRPKLEGSESFVAVNELISIKFKGKYYNVEEFELSFFEFKEIMESFVNIKSDKNIFTPVNTALDNAKMVPNDIDYILLIGGSSKSPYISQALRDHFPHASIINSGNLQTHVSKGVALNTALIHGKGRKLIDPVVSETISIKLIDETLLPLIEAGTSVPSELFIVKDLGIRKEAQSSIELPIYSSGSKKMIALFKIIGSFTSTDRIDLEISVDKNKKVLLRVFKNTKNKPNNELVSSVQFLPYSTELLSDYDRKVKELERKLFMHLSQGRDYKNSAIVRDLVSEIANLHSMHSSHKKALDIYLNFRPDAYTNISYHAAHCGRLDLNKKYNKLAYEHVNDGVSAYNYANEFPHDSDQYEKLMEESCQKGHASSKFIYGRILLTKYKDDRGKSLIKEAYDKFLKDFNDRNKGLSQWQYVKLKQIAHHYKDTQTLEQIKEVEKELKEERREMRKITNSENYLSNLKNI